MIITPHFTLEELTVSQWAARNGVDNTPNAEETSNLLRLCSTVLEPARQILGTPIIISSGFRCPAVNNADGGAVFSAHLDGRAADFTVPGIPLLDLYDKIARMDLPIDQLIYEYGAWIHAGIARNGEEPRRQLLMKFKSTGYLTFDPTLAARLTT